MAKKIHRHQDLDVYKAASAQAMAIYEISKGFPVEERYALTSQIRCSSRSVCANLAEAWRRRRYAASFVAKINDAEAEAAETQTWIEFAVKCDYITRSQGMELYRAYDKVLRTLVGMVNHADKWILPVRQRDRKLRMNHV